MAGIDQLLTQILNTKLGKDMRQAIHDSIAQCYDDVTSPELNIDAFETAVQNKIDSGELATMTIPDGSITVEKLDSNLSDNIDDIADLKSDLNGKVNANQGIENVGRQLVVGEDGNVTLQGEARPYNMINPSEYENSGYTGTLQSQFGSNVNVFDSEIDTSKTKTFYYRVYRNNQVYDHKVNMKVACYDSSGIFLYIMDDTSGDYTGNFETYIREDGSYSNVLETVNGQRVIVKIIAILTIPSGVSKIKFGIPNNSVMNSSLYPAFAVSDKQITNFGNITDGDYALTQNVSDGDANANKPLLNKTFAMIGDSLTNWGGGNDNNDGFLKIVHDRTGISTVNLGLAGATWEEADGQTQPGVTRVDTYVSGDVRYDCIGFLLGTNVANQGNITDTSATKTTMCGAIKYCLEKLIALSPITPIIVFLPPQRAEGNTEQKTRNDIIKQICEMYGVYTFDLYTRSQVIPNTMVANNGTLSDGLHLSEKGQQNFGRIMSTEILDVMGY